MRLIAHDVIVELGSTRILDGLSFTLKSGTITAVRGPSGSGKTTLLGAITGSVPIESGTIDWCDGDQAIPVPAGAVAWVPQGGNALGARTTLDNVLVAALSTGISDTAALRRSIQCLQRVDIAPRKRNDADTLSGGEQQRLSFARALALDRPLVLADEPTAGLDRANAENVVALLRSLRSRSAIVVATHDQHLIAACDVVVDLARGA